MDGNWMLSKRACEELAGVLKSDLFKPITASKTSIFLCGADIRQKNNFRSRLVGAFTESPNNLQYEVVYPEDLFDELLFDPKRPDLMSLENLLADSVDAIVIAPESPGSFAELGAFASDPKLRSKLICIIDNKYKGRKSFINMGPVQLVRKVNKKQVIFVNPEECSRIPYALRSALKKLKEDSNRSDDKIDLLRIDSFLLGAIYLGEPISRDTLVRIVSFATNDSQNAYQITQAGLRTLLKKREIEYIESGSRIKLSESGIFNFLSLIQTKPKSRSNQKLRLLDTLRLTVLNATLRDKRLDGLGQVLLSP